MEAKGRYKGVKLNPDFDTTDPDDVGGDFVAGDKITITQQGQEIVWPDGTRVTLPPAEKDYVLDISAITDVNVAIDATTIKLPDGIGYFSAQLLTDMLRAMADSGDIGSDTHQIFDAAGGLRKLHPTQI